jgi:DNA-damage-inducible protein J
MVISTARRLFIMANINVTLRMDEQLKKQADELFSDFGLTFNAAMTMFVKQSVREQRIPFEITRNTNSIVMASNDALASLSKQLIEQNKTAYEELAK